MDTFFYHQLMDILDANSSNSIPISLLLMEFYDSGELFDGGELFISELPGERILSTLQFAVTLKASILHDGDDNVDDLPQLIEDLHHDGDDNDDDDDLPELIEDLHLNVVSKSK
jgi:hypothetical protein